MKDSVLADKLKMARVAANPKKGMLLTSSLKGGLIIHSV